MSKVYFAVLVFVLLLPSALAIFGTWKDDGTLNKPLDSSQVIATSEITNFEGYKVTDDSVGDNFVWKSANVVGNHTVTINLNTTSYIVGFEMQGRGSGDPVCIGNFSIEYSVDGVNFLRWAAFEDNDGEPCTNQSIHTNFYNFTNIRVNASYMRVAVWNARSDHANNERIIYEIWIKRQLTQWVNPTPPSGTFISSNVTINCSIVNGQASTGTIWQNNSAGVFTALALNVPVTGGYLNRSTQLSVDGLSQFYCSFDGQENVSTYLYMANGGVVIKPTVMSLYNTREFPFTVNVTALFLKNVTITDGCSITYVNTTTGSSFFYQNVTNITKCAFGQNYLNITAWDSAGHQSSQNNSYFNMIGVNVSARYLFTQELISSFGLYINGTFFGNASDGSVRVNNLTPGPYRFAVNASGFALAELNATLTELWSYLNISVLGDNSLRIFIRDEQNNSIINMTTIDILFTFNETSFSYSTSNGTLYLVNLTSGEYTLRFSGGSYAARDYVVTIGNRTSQELTAYLSTTTSSTIFTVSDADTTEIIAGVSMSMYKIINGSWKIVEIKDTDITGKAQFFYVPLTNYKFFLSKGGYVDYVFYLNPILFASYDVAMTQSSLTNFSQDYGDVSLIYAPHSFKNGTASVFSFIIASPSGVLVEYGFNITFTNLSGVFSEVRQGSNAVGGQLDANLTPIRTSSFTTVRLDYHYTDSISGRRDFVDFLPIEGSDSVINGTMSQSRNKTYGMTIFERVFIAIIISLFVLGIASLFGQSTAGLVLALLVDGYLMLIGFVPWWIFAIPFLGGFSFVAWRSSA